MDEHPNDLTEPQTEPGTAETPGKPEQVASSETAQSETPALETPAPRRHSWIFHVFNFLLGANTPVGRIMRPVLRWSAAVVGLFALGLLAGYLLLYRPTQQALVSAQEQNAVEYSQIAGLKDQVSKLQISATAAAQSVKAGQDAVAKAQARNNLLVVIYDIANAHANLAQKDGATLIKTLDQARADLDKVQPYLQAANKDLADELNARLETVRSGVVRDATLAQSDLNNLFTALTSADDLIFGANP